MDMTEWLGLGGFLVAVVAAASTGAFFKPGAWYAGLNKPSWNPPNWLFGPAWGVLYTSIAVAGWLVWRRTGFGPEIGVWTVSLLLNAAWSWLFFGLRRMDLAFYELVAFWLSILAMILAFAGVRQDAALLLLPYLAWVTFAGVLNWTLWRMNPTANGNPLPAE
ncbi:TspO/MBR family protein [Falsiroseomonas sp. HW251]|uniref:TspO/MBR family protein n=1 Tax=Falsiroseomonas sp. HW251 TaxID=3390998 RepID=UPI003D31D7AE